ncbi:GNAT family N-acetyltransferase [Devosia geojensis]|uniref:GNAT family N-acetyltransferase n=1 Tax=Devosia geojensis TaxID=443610 RepID=UPI0009FEB486|nr:N-acetyltransferase [Devosia geojensis]
MTVPLASAAVPIVTHLPGIPYVRLATPADDAFVEELHAIAFGPGRFARTAFRVRERFPIDPTLSLIAEVDGMPCGSVWMTPISVGDVNGYLLGPLATHPDFRKRGAGKLLAREVTANALARGEGRFVLLVGDQDYYCPLGWRLTTRGAIVFPGPVDYDRVLAYAPEPDLALALAGPIAAFR